MLFGFLTLKCGAVTPKIPSRNHCPSLNSSEAYYSDVDAPDILLQTSASNFHSELHNPEIRFRKCYSSLASKSGLLLLLRGGSAVNEFAQTGPLEYIIQKKALHISVVSVTQCLFGSN
ncbi:hypothetical protein CEXT_176121 [Caerostris extrusa]|uniref:Uncharacterized protein n=1 Tax=Caerostris extrusa TaxID=172846 RepID=A0AAV4NXP2_CAEEX|nr:hypothetical protein CEXT_176121 [Caerostris extrusa]